MKKVFKNEGFTLIELLVVVAIIGILAAIAIPQFAEYRARGFDSRSVSDLRNAATAEEAYFADAEGYLTCSVTGSAGGPNNCGVLPAFSASIGVTVSMEDAGTSPPSFTGESYHTSGTRLAANPYVWNSNEGGLQ